MDDLDVLLHSLKLKDEQSSQGIVDKIQNEVCITKKVYTGEELSTTTIYGYGKSGNERFASGQTKGRN